MRFFDPHIHMTSRTTDDYQAMAAAGIRAIIEPAFWLGQPRTTVGSFEDYFRSIQGWEPFRASQFGIKHYCTIALNPKEANNTEIADGVIDLVKRFMLKESCVAIGEIGYDEQTKEEEHYFRLQMDLGKQNKLPVLVHSPHRDKKNGMARSMDIAKEVGIDPGLVLMDHNTEETIAMVREAGFWAGHSVYPETKMSPERMAAIVKEFGPEKIIINSAADWGVSDPLLVPKTAKAMLDAGIDEKTVEQITWRNPIEFFKQSGRINEAELDAIAGIDQSQLFEGNSVLRGQTPVVREATEK